MIDFIRPINYIEEKENQKIDMKEIFKSASLVLQIKKSKSEEETIIRISNSKLAAFNSRINHMIKINQKDKIDMFDLAGQSKRRLTVFRWGAKYERSR